MLAVVIKALFVQAFYIPSESMEPGLVKNDRILVQKVSYWFGGAPERGDVVVFEDPGGWLGAERVGRPDATRSPRLLAKIGLYPSGGHLVKRVIGVEGDTIVCCDEQGRISVNGDAARRGRLRQASEAGVDCHGPMTGNCDWTAGPVPEGHIFVMGDNRGALRRLHRAHVPPRARPTACPATSSSTIDLVVGKVFVLLWPRDRFGWLRPPRRLRGRPRRRVTGRRS